MKYKYILATLTCILITFECIAQLPENTVVFKVRKKSTPQIETNQLITDEDQIVNDGIWFVEEEASFQGGDIGTFMNWVTKQVNYPEFALENQISGKVIIGFTVDEKGKVNDVKVVKSVHPSIDTEAINAIQKSPRWSPAKNNGTPVKQYFVIPVMFTLQ